MPSVLLIEDDIGQRRLLERMLGSAHTVTWCADRETALAQLGSGRHDLWLIDYYLPGCDGLELLDIARRSDPHTAAIMLTSTTDPHVDRRALELGAAARLDKSGLTAERLSRAIAFAVHQARNLATLAEREAEQRALLDDPTEPGLRLACLARAEREVRSALAFDVIELDRGLFFGRLLDAGLSLTGCSAGFFGTVDADGYITPGALVGLDADAAGHPSHRPFMAPADSLLATALTTGQPLFTAACAATCAATSEPNSRPISGVPDWDPPCAVALPVVVVGRVAGIVLLAGWSHPPDARTQALLQTYAELCGGAIVRHDVDARRRRAEADLDRCDRLLRAVTGLAQRLPALMDEADALQLTARCLGKASGASRSLVAQRSPTGDWHRRMDWRADEPGPCEGPDDAIRRDLRLIERLALELARHQGSAPRAVPMLPGRPSMVLVPVPAAPPAGTGPDALPAETLPWGAVALLGSPLDVRSAVVRGILHSAGQALGAHLTRLDARRAVERAEALHRASEDARLAESIRFRALVERSSDLLMLLTADGRVRYQSPAARAVLGGATDDGTLDDRLHPDDRARYAAWLADCRAHPDAIGRCELRLRGEADAYRVVDLTVRNALHDPPVAGLVVNGRDVTEQRALWAQFLQARKLESLGRLATGLSHEFNNLLTVVLTSAAIATDGIGETHPVRADLSAIADAAETGARLVRRLLQFAGAQPATLRPLSIPSLIDVARPLWENLISDGIALDVMFEPDLGRVHADAHQLEHVLLHLVLNARDATPKGGRITVSARNASAPALRADQPTAQEQQPFVVVAVSDTGDGMSPEVQRHIFEPFFTTKQRGRATGLGLATVFGIVRRHGGRVTVDSAPGQGSTFRVWIPQAPGPGPTH